MKPQKSLDIAVNAACKEQNTTAEFLKHALEAARKQLGATKTDMPTPEGTELTGKIDPLFRVPEIVIRAPHNGAILTNGLRWKSGRKMDKESAVRFGIDAADALAFWVYEKLRLEKKNA